ncbi:MAG: FAD-dependent monooxygenase, partial [Alphaproteobacteria bacterium]|nr:FAD-dependent monooxygenase [Alphaproteobacteria bacterium]
VTHELLSQGLICPSWQIRWHPSGERAIFDLSVLGKDTRHPYRLQCEQWKLSNALLKRVLALASVKVNFSSEIIAAEERDGICHVTVKTASGQFSSSSRILIGADGARSIIRRAMNLAFDGETYPETTLLVTTHFAFEDHLEDLSNVTYCWKDGGNFSLLKVPGRWRVSIYPDENRPVEEQLSEESIEQNLQIIVPRSGKYEVLEKRPYRVHQRIVSSYRNGRMVLAGDSAHLNSPAGGMGLNGGIHDAFELAQAIVSISRKGAALDILDLYDRRRRPVARDQIIAQADRNRARMREREPGRRRELMDELKRITSNRDLMYAHLLRSSMIDGLRKAASIS